MARITKGIPGGFSAKAGTAAGANRLKQDSSAARPSTAGRQLKFKQVTGFLHPFKNIRKPKWERSLANTDLNS